MKTLLKGIFGFCMGFLVFSVIAHLAHALLSAILLIIAFLTGYWLYKEGIVKDWLHKMQEK